jgi:hypothetical protein
MQTLISDNKNLAQDQIEAIEAIDDWLINGTNNWFYLKGSPGSGKSFTLQQLIPRLLERYRIVASSPNDTALSELTKTLPDIDSRTIHSLMGFFPTSTEDGDKQLCQMTIAPQWDYQIVVVDEAGTIPAVILDAMDKRIGVRWLCLGDLGQLPPVKEMQSSLLHYVPEGNIFSLYINKRFDNLELIELVDRVKIHQISTNVPLLNNASFTRSFLQSLSRGEDAVFLAYRNVIVDKMTEQVRSLLYDAEPGSLPVQGEQIRMKMLMSADGKKRIRNNTDVIVLSCCAENIEVQTQDGEYYSIDFDVRGEIPAALKAAFKLNSRKGWAKYHSVYDRFPRWASKHCGTVHSRQGGTIDHVFIDWGDIGKAGNCPTMPFVAVSRARKSVMFR